MYDLGNWNLRLILLAIFFFTFSKEFAAGSIFPDGLVNFHCINNQYVRGGWFCDGGDDCGDGSDELYGCDSSRCGSGRFTCQSDFKCLPINVRCNTQTECEDGSDEKFCDHEPRIVDCKISEGKFLCNDTLRCIDLSQVCNLEPDCLDLSDENDKCDDNDYEICLYCPHACYRTPIGPHCFSHEEAGKRFTHCPADKNVCDQKCVTYRDTNQCSCAENFIYTDQFPNGGLYNCEEKDKNKNWLIYTTSEAIRGIQGHGNVSRLIEETKNSNVAAIAAGNEFVYWGGTYLNKPVIGRVSLSSMTDSANSTILISEGIDEINAIDVDWRTGNIYFIDNGKSHIAACRPDGKLCIEIHVLKNIGTTITLAPREGIMFWSIKDDTYGFVIRKGFMNGKMCDNFVEQGLGDIYSIACDETSEKLFWLDSSRRVIEMIRFNGEGRKIFKSDFRLDYLSITINAGFLYWNVNNSNSNNNPAAPTNPNIIYSSSGVQVEIEPKIAFNDSKPVLLIYGYSYSEKTTKMRPPCDWGCDNGVCLIRYNYRNKTGSECLCTNSSNHSGQKTNSWCRNNADNYHLPEWRIIKYNNNNNNNTETLNGPVRIILVVCSIIFVISVVCFYLYREGSFHGVNIFRHIR